MAKGSQLNSLMTAKLPDVFLKNYHPIFIANGNQSEMFNTFWIFTVNVRLSMEFWEENALLQFIIMWYFLSAFIAGMGFSTI